MVFEVFMNYSVIEGRGALKLPALQKLLITIRRKSQTVTWAFLLLQ